MTALNSLAVPETAGLTRTWGRPGFALVRILHRLGRTADLLLRLSTSLQRRYDRASLRQERRSSAEFVNAVARQLATIHGLEVVVRGPLPPTPAILTANHVSYLDPVAVASLIPCTSVAKREIGAWPVVGPLLQGMNIAWVERADPVSGAQVLRHAMRALAAGVSVLNFPEGTTTRGTTVLPLKRGVFGIASLTGTPVVPVAIAYDQPDMAWVGNTLFVPHYWSFLGRKATTAHLRFGPPIRVVPGDHAETIAERTRASLSELLQDLS